LVEYMYPVQRHIWAPAYNRK